MEVEIRGYKGYILNMIKHDIKDIYEIQLGTKNNIQIRLHEVKPEEINIIKRMEEN